MAKFDLPSDPGLARQMLDIQERESERGLFGKLFGAAKHAPTNIAGIVALFALISLLAIAFFPLSDEKTRPDLIQVFAGIAVSALSFMFGSLTSGSRE